MSNTYLTTGRLLIRGLAILDLLAGLVLVDGIAARVLLLAALLLVPLLIPVILEREGLPARLSTEVLMLLALPMLPASVLPTGPLAGVLTMPWLAGLVVVGLGILPALVRRIGDIVGRRAVLDLGPFAVVAFGAFGALFVSLSRFGVRPLGLPDEIVLLTAVHYHFAGVLLLGQALLVARRQPGPVAGAGVTLLVVGIPLVAVAFSTGSLVINAVGASLTALGGLGVAVAVADDARHTSDRLTRAGLGVSAVALLLSMPLALGWAAQLVLGTAWLDVGLMTRTHGLLNAIGVGLVGTFAQLRAEAGR